MFSPLTSSLYARDRVLRMVSLSTFELFLLSGGNDEFRHYVQYPIIIENSWKRHRERSSIPLWKTKKSANNVEVTFKCDYWQMWNISLTLPVFMTSFSFPLPRNTQNFLLNNQPRIVKWLSLRWHFEETRERIYLDNIGFSDINI